MCVHQVLKCSWSTHHTHTSYTYSSIWILFYFVSFLLLLTSTEKGEISNSKVNRKETSSMRHTKAKHFGECQRWHFYLWKLRQLAHFPIQQIEIYFGILIGFRFHSANCRTRLVCLCVGGCSAGTLCTAKEDYWRFYRHTFSPLRGIEWYEPHSRSVSCGASAFAVCRMAIRVCMCVSTENMFKL